MPGGLFTIYLYYFQAYMGVHNGKMLDVILSQSIAKKCVAAAWIYSITMALLIVFLVPENIEECPVQTNACLPTSDYYMKTRVVMALSILGIILGVTIMQILSFYELRKRLKNSVACMTNLGLNKLFKRAITKSALVAVAFSIGWAPICITVILYDWTNLDPLMLGRAMRFMLVLGFMQGFCNAIIFRAKYLKDFIQKKMSCFWILSNLYILSHARGAGSPSNRQTSEPPRDKTKTFSPWMVYGLTNY